MSGAESLGGGLVYLGIPCGLMREFQRGAVREAAQDGRCVQCHDLCTKNGALCAHILPQYPQQGFHSIFPGNPDSQGVITVKKVSEVVPSRKSPDARLSRERGIGTDNCRCVSLVSTPTE